MNAKVGSQILAFLFLLFPLKRPRWSIAYLSPYTPACFPLPQRRKWLNDAIIPPTNLDIFKKLKARIGQLEKCIWS